ncbi:hypothetical protein MNBD_GAMMA12-857 [hydrothermal vent metagenome]|uniref:Uncharacterized protein n=1 Tax=hydrothermal vent metagenome TaxID=652676 RepID=A0A3B0YN00_9ZZZZ
MGSDLLAEVRVLANHLDFLLNNVESKTEESLDYLSKLVDLVYRLDGRQAYAKAHIKSLSDLIWNIMAYCDVIHYRAPLLINFLGYIFCAPKITLINIGM